MGCFGGYDASCTTNKCSGLVGCNVCQDSNGKIPNNGVCQRNSQCDSGWCEGGVTGQMIILVQVESAGAVTTAQIQMVSCLRITTVALVFIAMVVPVTGDLVGR